MRMKTTNTKKNNVGSWRKTDVSLARLLLSRVGKKEVANSRNIREKHLSNLATLPVHINRTKE